MATRNRFPYVFLAAVLPLSAQNSHPSVKPTSSGDPAIVKSAVLEGYLLNDQTLLPLKRGTVSLRPKGGGKPAMGETDDSGKFSIPNIEPGQYTIEARRDGFLAAQWGRRGGIRMPRVFSLLAGQEIRDLTFRLRPFAVIEGKIKFDDAEAAMGVPVLAYRKTYLRGRLTYIVAGSARSNDRGVYRIPGLAPGNYVIAAIYNRPIRPRHDDDDPLDAPESEMSYSSTFYVSGSELRDAVPVAVRSGDELQAIDIFLSPVRTMRVRMEVTDGCTGQKAPNATIELFRIDAGGNGSIPVNADVQGRDGVYVIRGLVPGSYLVMASADPRTRECPGKVRTRRLLEISAYPVDNLRLQMRPPVLTQFEVRSDDSKTNLNLASIDFHLEPRSGHAENVPLSLDRFRRGIGRVAWLDSDEEYDLIVDRGLTEEYLAGPYQVQGSDGGRIQIGARGAQLYGVVLNEKREPVPGATITLIPDPAKDRGQLYGEAYANEQGSFFAQGIAPGRYIAVPWLDTAPCDFYNWESQEACRAAGVSVDLKPGDQKAVELILKVEP